MRAVRIPVISPQNWMAKLVEKVTIFALEKIIPMRISHKNFVIAVGPCHCMQREYGSSRAE
jgi:hypothetical protein